MAGTCAPVTHMSWTLRVSSTAALPSTLATIAHHTNDHAAAVAHQEMAVMLAERTLGLDHLDTIKHYVRACSASCVHCATG